MNYVPNPAPLSTWKEKKGRDNSNNNDSASKWYPFNCRQRMSIEPDNQFQSAAAKPTAKWSIKVMFLERLLEESWSFRPQLGAEALFEHSTDSLIADTIWQRCIEAPIQTGVNIPYKSHRCFGNVVNAEGMKRNNHNNNVWKWNKKWNNRFRRVAKEVHKFIANIE